MIQFHETVMGHRFFEAQLPALIRGLERLVKAVEQASEQASERGARAETHGVVVQVSEPDPLAGWGEFVARARARMEQGRAEYDDRSFARPPEELLGEMEQEILDWMGWGYILWWRLYKAKGAVPDGAQKAG